MAVLKEIDFPDHHDHDPPAANTIRVQRRNSDEHIFSISNSDLGLCRPPSTIGYFSRHILRHHCITIFSIVVIIVTFDV